MRDRMLMSGRTTGRYLSSETRRGIVVWFATWYRRETGKEPSVRIVRDALGGSTDIIAATLRELRGAGE